MDVLALLIVIALIITYLFFTRRLVFVPKGQKAVVLSSEQMLHLNKLAMRDLRNIGIKRDKIVAEADNEGSLLPLEPVLDSLDELIEENPNNVELSKNVERTKQNFVSKYSHGIPVSVAYQWIKRGEYIDHPWLKDSDINKTIQRQLK
ncbi:MAG: hypothetical protein KZQ90_18895 [Candidatus Thiodiazotropha sp. (ex Codakia rugifera)]|nr:hypothetical protein [Candidatus Thiodiazotropha sp. (ex Codakia rugifera)]